MQRPKHHSTEKTNQTAAGKIRVDQPQQQREQREHRGEFAGGGVRGGFKRTVARGGKRDERVGGRKQEIETRKSLSLQDQGQGTLTSGKSFDQTAGMVAGVVVVPRFSMQLFVILWLEFF